MATIVWELYEALREAEVSDVKAKAAAKAVLGEEVKSVLATKEDFLTLKSELKTDILEMEVRITRTILTAMISMTAIFAAIVKLF
ncbi:MAG: hypothetical protein H7839_19265 [Magnetococcus sp. YQC-5]